MMLVKVEHLVGKTARQRVNWALSLNNDSSLVLYVLLRLVVDENTCLVACYLDAANRTCVNLAANFVLLPLVVV